MVKNPGEAPGIGAIRPLNPPIPTIVVEDELGMPVAVAFDATQPPGAPRKNAPARIGVQSRLVGTPGFGVSPNSFSPGGGAGPPQGETRRARVLRPHFDKAQDFSFLGPAAEQSPDTRSIDYMLADTGAQSSLNKIGAPPDFSPEGGDEPPPDAPRKSTPGASTASFRGNGRTVGGAARANGVRGGWAGPIAPERGPRPTALRVVSIEDQWEIDEEWWRPRPLSRKYYQVLLEDGQTATLFRDMLNGAWHRQRY